MSPPYPHSSDCLAWLLTMGTGAHVGWGAPCLSPIPILGSCVVLEGCSWGHQAPLAGCDGTKLVQGGR